MSKAQVLGPYTVDGQIPALWNSVLFQHALITLARAGSKLLSSLSTKPEFYSEPICSNDDAPASSALVLQPPSSFQYQWGRNGVAPAGAPVAAEPKSLSLWVPVMLLNPTAAAWAVFCPKLGCGCEVCGTGGFICPRICWVWQDFTALRFAKVRESAHVWLGAAWGPVFSILIWVGSCNTCKENTSVPGYWLFSLSC